MRENCHGNEDADLLRQQRRTAPGFSLPVSRCREILASLMYGVSLLERTLRIGLRSTSSSSGAAAMFGRPDSVHWRSGETARDPAPQKQQQRRAPARVDGVGGGRDAAMVEGRREEGRLREGGGESWRGWKARGGEGWEERGGGERMGKRGGGGHGGVKREGDRRRDGEIKRGGMRGEEEEAEG